jgi:hypothetical protein
LDVLFLLNAEDRLVKRDAIQMDGKGAPEVLFTVTVPTVITQETTSGINVASYDPVFREWNAIWRSDVVSGTASPLPSAAPGQVDGFNGGDLLRTGAPIMAVRSTTRDGRAHLYLWRWDSNKQTGERLKMAGAGGAETDAAFDADLDVNLVDLDGDGKYEVVADNVADVQVWKWDGARFAPEGGR